MTGGAAGDVTGEERVYRFIFAGEHLEFTQQGPKYTLKHLMKDVSISCCFECES